jgi:AAA15 family ATPase/GTPase
MTEEAPEDDAEDLRIVLLHESQAETPARFDLSQESHGTRRLFGMLAPFYDVLSRGELAAIDEFSASLHPMIVRELVRLFHDPETNPHGAQLIFTTHDTNLLGDRLFRRDQVWFTEKDRSGATELYSLHDVKGVRADDAIEKGYLRGRYGAIPFLGELDLPALSRGRDAE